MKLTNEDIQHVISSRTPRQRTKKEPKPNLFITAYISYSNWEGSKAHPKKVIYKEVVKFMSEDKKIKTSKGTKLKSKIEVIKSIEQKQSLHQ